jgi:two-component system sensor histidine kinase/response regulator
MIDSTLKNAHILIVDDQQANIDVLTGLLELQGYLNVKTLTDPRMVVGLFKEFNPDLILLDLSMPHLTGFQVMEALKPLIPDSCYFPILVLTADISSESKQQALSGGAKDFLTKPFDLIEVDLRIKNLLATRRLHLLIENQNEILEEKVEERTIELEIANQNLNNANEELKILDRAKSEFLQIISHEIRTPLNGILGFTNILKEDLKNSAFSDALDYLDISAKRLFRFSNAALMITELKTNAKLASRKDIPMDEVVEYCMAEINEKVQSKQIQLIRKIESGLVILAESDLLKICFQSILDNAVENSFASGKIEMKGYSEKGNAVIEFIDEGKGFSDKAMKNLFRMFSPGEQHVDQNIGLDLALVKLIMDAHKGRIHVSNNPDKGATVRLEFPSEQ